MQRAPSQPTAVPRRLGPRSVALVAALGGALALVVALIAGCGPLVRARVAREAERRQLDVEVGRVRPGFFAVTLRDVRVRPRGVSGLEARLDEVRVDLTTGLSLRELAVHGGSLHVEGEPEDVAERLRKREPGPERGGGSGSKAPVSAEDLTLAWTMPSGGEITGAGLRFRRDGTTKVACAKCTASHVEGARKVAVEVRGAEIELEGSVPQRVSIDAMDVLYTPPPEAPAPAPKASAAELTPPPLPPRKGRAPKDEVVPWTPVLRFPDLHALRARIASALGLAGSRLPDGMRVDIGGLSLKVVEKAPLAFGPGRFHLTRHGERLQLEFASADESASDPKRTPLSIDADLPLGAGDMVARLAGGPVSLTALGVQEGMRGLTDVGKGTVSGKGQLVLAAGAEALTFDGELSLRGLSLSEPRVAIEPLRGIDLTVSGRGVLDDAGRLRLDDAELTMGALHARSRGRIEETADHFAIAASLDVAPAACQALLDSAPQGLLPTVRAARMSGTFAANVSLSFDTRTIDKLALEYRIDDRCRMVEVPRELSQERFAGSFTYRTYHPDGTTGETTTGPGTPAWTNIDDISPFMITAVLTTEDGAFYRHHGFNHAAIRSSVAANLKARRFVRGASTISMQLAKNVFLSRDKAMARKIEEVILTDYLEQVFRKDDMMELYLNVIEFGPDVYGITRAADHYFGRKPEELSLGECFFLASLLPSPNRYGKLHDKAEVSESWMRHLRALMEIAAKNGKISRVELDEGLKAPVVFYHPGEPRPTPRKPVTTTRRDPSDDDDAWRPVD